MASKTKRALNRSLGTLDMSVNKELANNIKLHPSLWCTVKYTQDDEMHWNSISTKMGIQKSWLKRRWNQLRTAYNSDPALSKHLSFLKKPTKRTDRTSDKTKDEHQIDESDEFNVTQEQLDESMDEPSSSTIHFDADNDSTGSCHEYEFTIVSDAEDAESSDAESLEKVKTIKIEKVVENGSGRTASASRQKKKSTPALNESSGSEVNEMEYQDKVFGDLVSAMLAKMTPEKKKQAKKEIMNILL